MNRVLRLEPIAQKVGRPPAGEPIGDQRDDADGYGHQADTERRREP
jgi:hypothetical protein